MYSYKADLWRKTGILAAMVFLALAVVSCGDDDPVAPVDPPGNRAPGTPVINTPAGGPADGATGISLAAVLHWTCPDADGDVLAYTVHFGTVAAPPVVSADQAGTSYDPASLDFDTKYYWKIVAKDPDGETSTSTVWDFTTAAQAVETVSQPDPPTGPDAGLVGESLEFTASGATSSFGAPVEYRFDWGGGDLSVWSTATTVLHSWAAEGTFDVITQARSTNNNAIESDWSAPITVEITAPLETITMTTQVSGPDNMASGVAGDFTISGFVTSSEGHDTEWRFVWGDGTFSDWLTVKSGSHTYDAAGEYTIDLQGRCILHPAATHERVNVHRVTVAASETITPPTQVGNISGHVYSSYEYWIDSHATSSFGHLLELRYDFGDGVISDWIPEYTRATHTWALGTYDVVAQARCVEHPDILSEWGVVKTATFKELVSGLGQATGPTEGVVGVPVAFTATPATNNEGHPIEYRYMYRRFRETEIFYGDWFPTPEGTLTFPDAGTKYVYVQARCIEHPDIMTTYSREYVTIVISPAP